MVNNQVDVTTRQVDNTTIENTFQVSGTLTTFEGIDLQKQETDVLASGLGITMNYDFLVASSGAALGVDVDVNHRSLTVGPDITPGAPVVITDFFNNILAGGELFVSPREVRDGQITYDIFYASVGSGLVDAELTVVTLIVPPGTLPAVAVTTVAPLDAKMVFREWRGTYRVYDVFFIDGA